MKRAVLGPVGFFVGTTNMTFDTTFNDASGSVVLHKQIKGTSRGESESTNVADGVAKSVASVTSTATAKTAARVSALSTQSILPLLVLSKGARFNAQ